jgi:hypothetical protein
LYGGIVLKALYDFKTKEDFFKGIYEIHDDSIVLKSPSARRSLIIAAKDIRKIEIIANSHICLNYLDSSVNLKPRNFIRFSEVLKSAYPTKIRETDLFGVPLNIFGENGAN